MVASRSSVAGCHDAHGRRERRAGGLGGYAAAGWHLGAASPTGFAAAFQAGSAAAVDRPVSASHVWPAGCRLRLQTPRRSPATCEVVDVMALQVSDCKPLPLLVLRVRAHPKTAAPPSLAWKRERSLRLHICAALPTPVDAYVRAS
jgi:hypothetical protein